jgi:homopolymeric O-antigen transport system permease protein
LATASLRLQQSLELLYLLVRKDLKVRYKSSVLGYVWALANPFLFAFVYWIAFKFVMRVQMENYSIFLITGMFPWIWLSSGVTLATRVFQTNSSLVKKVNLNRAVLPLSIVVEGMVHFLLAFPVIIIFLAFAGGEFPKLSWVWQVPLLIAVQLLFTYPLALVFSIANVFVHDVEHLVGVGFMLLFFATPMVYPITMVPQELRPYFVLNPVHALIDGWRAVLLDGTLHVPQFLYCLAWGVGLGIIAFAVFRKYGHRLGELL